MRNLLAGALLSATALVPARADTLYVTDFNGTIGRYVTGTQIWTSGLVTGLNMPTGIALSGSNLFVASYGDGVIGEYTINGDIINGSLVANLGGPAGIAITDSRLFVANLDAGTVAVYGLDGVAINTSLISGLNCPWSIAVSDSNIYVGTDGGVGVYDMSGMPVNADLIPGTLATGLALAGKNLYVADGVSGRVTRYTLSSGAVVASFPMPGFMTYPNGLAVSDTCVYAVNGDPPAIRLYSTGGTLIRTSLVADMSKSGNSVMPFGITVESSFNLPLPVYPPADYLPPGTPLLNINPATQVSHQNKISGPPGQYWGFNEDHGDGMVGWTFTLTQPTIIWQVGWYDADRDGLSRDYQVGLWTDVGDYLNPKAGKELLGWLGEGIMIPAGTPARLIGCWRVVDLPEPLLLLPGYYVLGGLDTSATTDTMVYALMDFHETDPDLTGGRLRIGPFFYGYGDPLGGTEFHQPQFGSFYLENGLELGPMLFFNAPYLEPEPSTLLIVAVALPALLLRQRRRTNDHST
jgi:hypothetical protein